MKNKVFLIRKYHPDESIRNEAAQLLSSSDNVEMKRFVNKHLQDIPPVGSRIDYTQLNLFGDLK